MLFESCNSDRDPPRDLFFKLWFQIEPIILGQFFYGVQIGIYVKLTLVMIPILVSGLYHKIEYYEAHIQ